MAKEMTVYKVVRTTGDKYYSSRVLTFANNSKEISELELEYSIGVTTRPKIGKIFAFDNGKHAEHFLFTICSDTPSTILLCSAMVMANTPEYVPSLIHFSLESLKVFWKLSQKERDLIFRNKGTAGWGTWVGTVMCNSITPKEIVYR